MRATKVVSKTVVLAATVILVAAATAHARVDFNVHVGVPVPVPAPVVVAPAPPPAYYPPQPPPAYYPPQPAPAYYMEEPAPPVTEFVVDEPPSFIYSPRLGFYVSVGTPYDMAYIDNAYYLYRGGYWYCSPSYWGPWSHVHSRRMPPMLHRHSYDRIRYYRDREYRHYMNDRDHYRGSWYRPVARRDWDRRNDHSRWEARRERDHEKREWAEERRERREERKERAEERKHDRWEERRRDRD